MADDFAPNDGRKTLLDEIKITLQLCKGVRIAETELIDVLFDVEVQRQTQNIAIAVVRRTVVEYLIGG